MWILLIALHKCKSKSFPFLPLKVCVWIWWKGKMWCDHRNSNQVFLSQVFIFWYFYPNKKIIYVFLLCACMCALVSFPCSTQPVNYFFLVWWTRAGHPRDILNQTGWTIEVFKALLCYVLLMPLRWFALTFSDALCLQQISCHHKTAYPGFAY